MLTISNPLSAGQVTSYYTKSFANAKENYYTEGDVITGQWHGRLAERWGLIGAVTKEQYDRLAWGRDPWTGEQLVRLVKGHRAGWDAVLSAPKSVSLVALVGGDNRVREAHRQSVAITLDALERYTQARIGGKHLPETTRQWVAATFEHDSARPVAGYAAPQIHTHVVVMNMARTTDGKVRAVQPWEWYRSRAFVTAVYRTELATRLKALGYEVEVGLKGEPRIKGFTQAYLDASSPRSEEIKQHLASRGLSGPAAAKIAAQQTRAPKQDLAREEVLRQHLELAQEHDNQPARAVEQARSHTPTIAHDDRSAREAVQYAKARRFERSAVNEDRAIKTDALRRGMGEVTLAAVNREFQRRYDLGEFVDRRPWRGSAANAYTTPEMVALEHANLAHMKASLGQRQPIDRAFTPAQYDYLNPDQQAAVHRIVTSPDALMALDGVAGSGKTTALVAVREQAERAGFDVYGLAPTSPAAAELAKTGVQTCTLQRFLVADPPVAPGQRERVLFLDESSMVSSEQMRTLQARLRPTDRVILVGDVRQHQAVDAGVPYQQFHGAGLEPAKLSEVVRQQGPGYRRLVHQVARGDVTGALADLTRRGRIHEIQNQSDRFDAIAKRFVQDPVNTLLVSPDNDSRTQLNTIVHTALQANRTVGEDQAPTRVLVTRHAMHGIDRQHADLYEVGDRLRYTKGSKVYGITPGEYATVTAADRAMNTLTVQRSDGSTLAYDPSRLHCVGVFEPQERAFAVGERVQFTCPDRTLRVTNRQRGTITDLDATQATIRLDAGRTVRVDLTQPAHLDYGYCTTSYSSQSLTAEKVILHVDSAHAHSELVNRRLCYVAFSRGQRELQVYTDDSKMLERSLNRDVSKRQAIEPPRHELGMAV